ncbi:putative capsular polysaccharide synthesis family protein [Pseudalkalibacillus sp. JSM 102089]|uniref:putative capsular polysaccharide synthesis family protein n=1 Tax=Pseudalkalibacillus sp. JSM 102089 TaxID=3229856 RepID=UPI003523B702
MYDKATANKLSLKEKLNTWFFNEKILLVYTMGKVGSSSIVNSIRQTGMLEVQPHSLTFNKRGTYFVIPPRDWKGKTRDVIKTLLLKAKVASWKIITRNKKIKVISIVREPISRNLSAFFEQAQYVSSDFLNKSNDEIEQLFWKYANHNAPLVWFDKEINKVFGIDVYQTPLNDSNYSIIKHKNVELLILRLENLAEYERVIGEFLDVKEFSLNNANVGSNKEYSAKYNEIKKSIEIPENYLNQMYESKYMQHFYSKSEITHYRKKYNKHMSHINSKVQG